LRRPSRVGLPVAVGARDVEPHTSTTGIDFDAKTRETLQRLHIGQLNAAVGDGNPQPPTALVVDDLSNNLRWMLRIDTIGVHQRHHRIDRIGGIALRFLPRPVVQQQQITNRRHLLRVRV
jgi:hypothetical protein